MPPAPPAEPSRGAWPLPPTGLDLPPEKVGRLTFPHATTLMDIAIQERRHDDVLRRYHVAAEGRGCANMSLGVTVAEAVQETHPNEALAVLDGLEAKPSRIVKG
jgi:hypothetical protein